MLCSAKSVQQENLETSGMRLLLFLSLTILVRIGRKIPVKNVLEDNTAEKKASIRLRNAHFASQVGSLRCRVRL
jgi:hypothetical protein